MKKEFVEDYAIDYCEQELDMMNDMTEAIKYDPDYNIEEESSLSFLQLDRILILKKIFNLQVIL